MNKFVSKDRVSANRRSEDLQKADAELLCPADGCYGLTDDDNDFMA